MSTLTILLIALAVSDILAPQTNAVITFSYYHLSKEYKNSILYLKFNSILRYIIQPLCTLFTMTSSWIVTTTTMVRLIAVIWPLRARTLINRRFGIICLLIIFGISSASIIPLYINLTFKSQCTQDKKLYSELTIEPSSEIMSKLYLPYIQTMCFYLPWLIALILWLRLLKTLRQSEKNFNILLMSKDTAPSAPTSTLIKNSSSNTLETQNKRTSAPQRSSISIFRSNQNLQVSLGEGANTNVVLNSESRMNNAQTRKKSYNKITLMVVVLCFTNLICRVFTFAFIFELIYNEYAKLSMMAPNSNGGLTIGNNQTQTNQTNDSFNNMMYLNARMRFPYFLSYSLLLNNIFLTINHGCNIFVYTFTNPRFRKNLFDLFKSDCVGKQKNVIKIIYDDEKDIRNKAKRELKRNSCQSESLMFERNKKPSDLFK